MKRKDGTKNNEAIREHRFLNLYPGSKKSKELDLEQRYVVPWQMMEDIHRQRC